MRCPQIRKFSIEDVEKAINLHFHRWRNNCHSVSLAMVKSDLFEGPRRVARGCCDGVSCQHSWIVLGRNCYIPDALVDPTLWAYDSEVEGIWYGSKEDSRHHPLGEGLIFDWGMPMNHGGEHIELELSGVAAAWMDLLPRPHDTRLWHSLLSEAPAQGWPAAEITAAAYNDERLKALIPIDRVGMLTDINPGGLYLPNNWRQNEHKR